MSNDPVRYMTLMTTEPYEQWPLWLKNLLNFELSHTQAYLHVTNEYLMHVGTRSLIVHRPQYSKRM